ncbi:hypothetical protein [uncultured Dechloromonas sp.]|uniref:hypothetical protein n=1 Tax=uncultured Dechloromonas sp. TaxID=171719 RepID=UPI0025EE2F2D|nr:hypothetical protein [uncultured Dechloromonas sp.]
MSVEPDILSPYSIANHDFRDDANTSMLADLGRFAPLHAAYLDRCAMLLHITNQVCSVQSDAYPAPIDDRSLHELCQEILRTKVKPCTFIKPSPADTALEGVLTKLGLRNGAIERLYGKDIEATKKGRDFVLDGFLTRLREALQSEGFCKKQRAWLKPVNKNRETCNGVLDALEASPSPVYCVRHEVVHSLDQKGASQQDWPRTLAQALFELPADLGLIAVLCRGERLPSGDFRCHVVIFFGGGTKSNQQAIETATRARLSRIPDSTCTKPLGYRSVGEGLLTPGCKPLRHSLRAMLSRDEFIRSDCSPALSFSFHKRDDKAFRLPANSSEVAREG